MEIKIQKIIFLKLNFLTSNFLFCLSGFSGFIAFCLKDTLVNDYALSFEPHICPRNRVDLSRFSAAPRARLSHLSFESDRAFPAQC